MGKFKEVVKSFLGDQKQIIKKYCLTFGIIYLVTIIMIIQGFSPDYIRELYTVLILTDILVFTIESLLDLKWYRIPLYIVAFILSIITKGVIFSEDVSTKQVLFIAGMYISVTLVGIYKIIKDSKITFSQYWIRVFNNEMLIGIASSVIQAGALFIAFIITALLFGNINSEDIFIKCELFVIGFIIIPMELLGIIYVKNEILKPVEILISYIILPILIIAKIIIYIYFIKIIVIREIPSNVIYPIIAGLFTASFPTWCMIGGIKNKNKYLNANLKILPYSFLPLVLLQIYAIGVRVAEMGLTPSRYLGIALIIFEIIASILTIIKQQKHLINIIIVAIGFVLVIMCVPSINVIDASWKSQLKRMTSVYKEGTNYNDLTEEQKAIVKGAYRYLKYDSEGEKHIPGYIDTNLLDNVANYYSDYDYENDYYGTNIKYKTIDYYTNEELIPVEGYNYAKRINIYGYSYNEENALDDLSTENVEEYAGSDAKEIIKNFVIESINEDRIKGKTIKLDNNSIIWISNISIRYNTETKDTKDISIDGYLLIK